MSNILQSMPDNVAGFLLLGLGGFVLLNTWGVIHGGILVHVAALMVMWYGFMLLQGPKRIRHLLDKMQMGRKD